MARHEYPPLSPILHGLVKRAPSGIGAQSIADMLGWNYPTMMSELSGQPGHKLGVDKLLPIMDVTDGDAPMHFLARERAGAALERAQQGVRLVRRQKPHGCVLGSGQAECAAAFDRKRIGDAQASHLYNMVDGPAQEPERVTQALVAKRLRQPLLGVDQDLRRDSHDGQGVQPCLEVELVAVALGACGFAFGVRPGVVGDTGRAHGVGGGGGGFLAGGCPLHHRGRGRGRVFAGRDLLEQLTAHLVGVGRPDAVGVAADRVPAELAAGVAVAHLIGTIGYFPGHPFGRFAVIYAGILCFDVLSARHGQEVPHGGDIGNDVSNLLAEKAKGAAACDRNPLNSFGGQCRIRTYGLWLRRLAASSSSRYCCILYRRVRVSDSEPAASQITTIPTLVLAGSLASVRAAFVTWNAYGAAPAVLAAGYRAGHIGHLTQRPAPLARPLPPSDSEAALRRSSPPHLSLSKPTSDVLAASRTSRVLPELRKSSRALGAGGRGNLRKKSGGKTERWAPRGAEIRREARS
ncbi:MAG: hypothetical protein AB7V08_14750 [Elusimicrobiales bacterium]